MKLARVIGTVVATQKYETLISHKILMIQPLNDDMTRDGRPIAAIDTIQAGPGDLTYWVMSREAALALPENYSPIDAAIVGIVDQVNSENTPIKDRKKIFIKESK